MTDFGPTFSRELIEAGLGGFGLGWTDTEIFGRENLTTEQSDALDLVIAAHDPEAEAPRYLTRKAFAEQLAAEAEYANFITWKLTQSEALQVYFDEEASFLEDDAKIADAMTALSLTTADFFTSALT
jgi:hypothetical protein